MGRRGDVIALTVLDGSSLDGERINGDTRVLICVRDGAVNLTHPDIVSVPTKRVPAGTASDLLVEGRRIGKRGDTALYEGPVHSSNCGYGTEEFERAGLSPSVDQVRALIGCKLGQSEKLACTRITFSVTLAGVQEGTALYPNLGREEELRMINLRVTVESGSEHFHNIATAEYSKIRWATVEGYRRMWETRDVTKVGISPRDALRGVCVDGLCISSTYDVLSEIEMPPERRHRAA